MSPDRSRLLGEVKRFFWRGCAVGAIIALVVHVQALRLDPPGGSGEVVSWTMLWLLIWGGPVSLVVETLAYPLVSVLKLGPFIVAALTISVPLNWGLLGVMAALLRHLLRTGRRSENK